MERIEALHTIEKEVRAKPSEHRRSIREARAGQLLDGLKIWLHKQLSMVSAKSSLAQAIGYALSRWMALTCYLCDARI